MLHPSLAARENDEAFRHKNTLQIFEIITAAVKAHGEGKIAPDEMRIESKTRDDAIRYAPGFSQTACAPSEGAHPYTVEALAKFLGMVKPDNQRPRDSFVACFGALELIDEGYLSEARAYDLEKRKLGQGRYRPTPAHRPR
jgi:hypothetical protein